MPRGSRVPLISGLTAPVHTDVIGRPTHFHPPGWATGPSPLIRRRSQVQAWLALSSAGRLQGVADGLDSDEAVAEDEGVDGVLDAVAAALGAPLQEQDVVFEEGG